MGRIVDGVTGDPMRIDRGSIKRHGEVPVVRGESGLLRSSALGGPEPSNGMVVFVQTKWTRWVRGIEFLQAFPCRRGLGRYVVMSAMVGGTSDLPLPVPPPILSQLVIVEPVEDEPPGVFPFVL